jgi:hypothetical protein
MDLPLTEQSEDDSQCEMLNIYQPTRVIWCSFPTFKKPFSMERTIWRITFPIRRES